MRSKNKKVVYQFLALLVPLLTFSSPPWLSINGVEPRWAELWLLPWALEEGSLSGSFAGFCLGIILDSINLQGGTQIPSLMLLGFCWGFIGKKREYNDRIFEIGLLAWLGSFVSGIFVWLQEILFIKEGIFFLFNAWAFYSIFAAAILNGLLAPLICSSILKTFFKGVPRNEL